MSPAESTSTENFLKTFTLVLLEYFDAADELCNLKPEIEKTRQLILTIIPRRNEISAQRDLLQEEAEFWRVEIHRLQSEIEELRSPRQLHVFDALIDATTNVESERLRLLNEWRVNQAEWMALAAEDRILHERFAVQSRLTEKVTQRAYDLSITLLKMHRSVSVSIMCLLRAT